MRQNYRQYRPLREHRHLSSLLPCSQTSKNHPQNKLFQQPARGVIERA
jgi:hypothetical protein